MRNTRPSRLALVITFALAPLVDLDGPSAQAEPSVVLDGVVNINTASVDELELLPGVGPAKAARIVAYRQQHPFRTVDELARVKGIGPRTVARLRTNLVVRGPTTAQERSRRRRGEPDAVSAAGPPRSEPAPPSAPPTSRPEPKPTKQK